MDQLSSRKTYSVRFEVTNSVLKIGLSEKSPPNAPRQGILTTSSSSREPITSATVSWNSPLPSLPNDVINGYIAEWWTMDKFPEIHVINLQYTSTRSGKYDVLLEFTASPIPSCSSPSTG